MKTIPNVILDIEFADLKKPVTVAKLLKICLTVAPQGGFDYKTMRDRLKIEDVLVKVKDGGKIELEDADFATAVQSAQSMKWGVSHKDLVKFGELFGL
jgi:hypothetical protein